MPTKMQQQNMDRLNVMLGEGILNDNFKTKAVQKPVLLISLGGLGGETLNLIKRETMRRLTDTNQIKFLAVDSDKNAINQITRGNDQQGNAFPNRYLNTDETHLLTSNNLAGAIAAVPPHIAKWKNPNLDIELAGQGCGGIRQQGRFLLSIPAVFNDFRAAVQGKLNDLNRINPGANINVILIFGVGGGTGSGTFIDISYILHEVITTAGTGLGRNNTQYAISSYIFMPDVQTGINGVNVAGLNRNGYAALKELDYFNNIENVGGAYHWPFGGAPRQFRNNIYKYCTLVSGYSAGGAVPDRKAYATNVVVENIISLLSDSTFVDANGNTKILLESVQDNNRNNLNAWYQQADEQMFPRSANYTYSVTGYGSANIPVDAVMSYLAHEMYGEVLAEYQNMDDLTQPYVNNICTTALPGIGIITTDIKDQSHTHVIDFQNLDRAVSALRPRDIIKRNSKYKELINNLITRGRDYEASENLGQRITEKQESILNIFDNNIETSFNNFGPYFVNMLITAEADSDSNVDGILNEIEKFRDRIEKKLDNSLRQYRFEDDIRRTIDRASEVVTRRYFATEQKNKFLRSVKMIIEEATVNRGIYRQLINVLNTICENITIKSNSVFNVYTEILDYIFNTLNKNSMLVASGNRGVAAGGGITYSIDIIDLDVGNVNGARLKQYLGEYLSKPFVANFKTQFKNMIRNPLNRPAFTSTGINFDAQGKMRDMFTQIMGTFYSEAVERLVMMYYDPSIANAQALDQILGNAALGIPGNPAAKQKSLNIAATAIVNNLINHAQTLCQLVGGANVTAFARTHKYVSCPAVSQGLFNAIKMAFANTEPTIEVYRKDNSSRIECVTNYFGIPLTFIGGMDLMEESYDAAIANGTMGIHLDEATITDWKELPSPLVKEMWNRHAKGYQSTLEQANLDRVSNAVDKAYEYRLITTPVDAAGVNKTSILKTLTANSIDENLRDDIIRNIEENQNAYASAADPIQLLINNLPNMGVSFINTEIRIGNSGIVDTDPRNIKLIMRKNMDLYRKLKATISLLDDIVQYVLRKQELLGTKIRFDNDLNLFINYLRFGLIKYSNDTDEASFTYDYDGINYELLRYDVEPIFIQLFRFYFAFSAFRTRIGQDNDLLTDFDDRYNVLLQDHFQYRNEQFYNDLKKEATALHGRANSANAGDFRLNQERMRQNINQAALAYMQRDFSSFFININDVCDLLRYFDNRFYDQL